MADSPEEPNEPTPDAPESEPTGDPSALGDPGKKALDAERNARREAEKRAKELAERLQEIEDAEKSDLEKLQEAQTAAEQRASAAEKQLLVLQVAADKGLTPAQAKRLTGNSREELEADADELLELLAPPEQDPPPGGRPKRLVNGNQPDADGAGFDAEDLANRIYERSSI